ncbi:hypothetical protein [uncultured Agrobacterium sp.]|uniref:hypothetical protein n=1 Tax=uncultured Agrobacterium sp. TaxID=157277 RepID=UPI0025D72E12|nr:hypothetical protein [uncultured Agrobacterium sp.]
MTPPMDEDQDETPQQPLLSGQSGPGEKAKQREAERKARAAKKLRENLARRKQQLRARRAGDEDDTIGLPAVKTNESSGQEQAGDN